MKESAAIETLKAVEASLAAAKPAPAASEETGNTNTTKKKEEPLFVWDDDEENTTPANDGAVDLGDATNEFTALAGQMWYARDLEEVESDDLPRPGTREQSDSTSSTSAAVPQPRNPTVTSKTAHSISVSADDVKREIGRYKKIRTGENQAKKVGSEKTNGFSALTPKGECDILYAMKTTAKLFRTFLHTGTLSLFLAGGCATSKTIVVKPGESLITVRNHVRALLATNHTQAIVVQLPPGTFYLTSPLALKEADSGREEHPVIWRGARDGSTRLTSGIRLDPNAFKQAEGLAAGILVAEITPQGWKWPAEPTSEVHNPWPAVELFVDGARYELAGWPDAPTVASPDDKSGGWATIDRFINEGYRANSGSVTDAGKAAPKGPRFGGTFGYTGDRPTRWLKAQDVFLHGFWCFDWYESRIPIRKIDTTARTIELKYHHAYGVRRGNPSPRRWRAVNLLEELDRPGEYYADKHTGKLYLIPRDGWNSKSEIILSCRDMNTILLAGASNVQIENLELFGIWRTAIVGRDINNVQLRNLVFHGVRERATYLSNAKNCRIQDCTIYDMGFGGIYLTGGERKTLTPSGNVIEGNRIYSFSKNVLTSAYAINTQGCGNRAAHNIIYDAPHQAISMGGNDNIFEYNVVSNVVQCTDDAGAYYVGRNPSCRGNIIRHCLFADIGSDRGHGNAAIYFDDGDSDNLVYNCTFRRCGAPGKGSFGAVFSHGGYSNIVRQCTFENCGRALGSAPWTQKHWEQFLQEPFMQKRLKQDVDIESDAYQAHYPGLRNFYPGHSEELRWNAAYDNTFIGCKEIAKGKWFTNETNRVISK